MWGGSLRLERLSQQSESRLSIADKFGHLVSYGHSRVAIDEDSILPVESGCSGILSNISWQTAIQCLHTYGEMV
jgi:hypothetical protein